ncbi:hypothetical protein BJ878DRAFT_429035 [Calycina marina]|uniref:RED-like N-terminal domain-containing protein n=1 Tax=Calycina marina TaxID=1763456 RepID=A0A9P8CBW9_9HELO|nr:hypothetical protein BJ878DRAFT_429035 [Calycina marina]
MNNSQFRKLVLDTPTRQTGSGEIRGEVGARPRRDGATSSALGSRMRSSIPMTPRSLGGIDFARQLAEQKRAAAGEPPTKKFRSAAAPKGVKLADGYVDRAKQWDDQESDDRAERVKALEEMMKLQQIDEATFVQLRDEILGGAVESTHLVKGLDWKLLERVKRGEDVLSGPSRADEEEEQPDLEDQFDELEATEVKAVQREEREKKGQMAPPILMSGRKRTRDQILAELKAARKTEKEAKGPSLGARFKKVGEKKFEPRIEKDSKGRDVLITIDEHGNEKRKVRKPPVISQEEKGHGLLMPDKDAAPLGMEVPEIPRVMEEADEEDIFADAGDDYDPLAGLDDDDDDDNSSDKDGEVSESKAKNIKIMEKEPKQGSMAPPPIPKKPTTTRNYFGDTQPEAEPSTRPATLADPTILAAIRKAATLAALSSEPENPEAAAKEARRKRMLQQDDRDAQDMDMGFGGSRNDDEEDFDDKKIKLSQWGGRDEDGDDRKWGKNEKMKRGGKKRKGDANSAADVISVMERRKTARS